MEELISVSCMWKAEDAEERIEVVERFLAATSEEDYRELCRRYPLLFGWKTSPSVVAAPSDFQEVCELLRKAKELYALCAIGGKLDTDDLLKCGVSPSVTGWVDPGSSPDEEENLMDVSASLAFSIFVRSQGYSEWLSGSATEVASRFSGFRDMTMDFRGGWLMYHAQLKDVAQLEEPHEYCREILKQLFNLHLADVSTVVDEQTMNQRHVPYSGVSLLWLGLSELLSAGRAFRCEACGKPSIAFRERRQKRYCCDACRKWASKHPNEKRGHWYY